MPNPSKQIRGLVTSLIGRKCMAAMAHLWFGAVANPWEQGPLPTDQGTIVAAFTSKEDGTTVTKILVESEKGEIKEFYAEHVLLVPEIK